ncbi:hypothetical protein ACS0TY_007384 [Phlomoides rotata]
MNVTLMLQLKKNKKCHLRTLNLLKMNRLDFKILWAGLDKLKMQRLITHSECTN